MYLTEECTLNEFVDIVHIFPLYVPHRGLAYALHTQIHTPIFHNYVYL